MGRFDILKGREVESPLEEKPLKPYVDPLPSRGEAFESFHYGQPRPSPGLRLITQSGQEVFIPYHNIHPHRRNSRNRYNGEYFDELHLELPEDLLSRILSEFPRNEAPPHWDEAAERLGRPGQRTFGIIP